MSDQPTLFVGGPEPLPEPPKLNRGERLRLRQQERITAGVHPLNGLPLAGNGHTCGDCCHRYLKRLGSAYPKCDRGPNTASDATDVRAWWPACRQWETT